MASLFARLGSARGKAVVAGSTLASALFITKNDTANFQLTTYPTQSISRHTTKLMQFDTREFETSISTDELDLERNGSKLFEEVDRCHMPMQFKEFGRFMGHMGINDHTTTESIFRIFSANGRNVCPSTHAELALWCSKVASNDSRKLKFAFSTCDLDKDGRISKTEFQHFLKVLFAAHGSVKGTRKVADSTVYEKLGNALVDDIFAEANKAGQEQMDFGDFKNWFEKKTTNSYLVADVLDDWLKHSVAVLL